MECFHSTTSTCSFFFFWAIQKKKAFAEAPKRAFDEKASWSWTMATWKSLISSGAEKRNQKEENIAFLLSFNSKINIWKPPVRTPKKANSSYTCFQCLLHVGRSSTNVGFSSCKIFFENFYVAHQSQALSLIASSLCSGFASLLWCLFLNFSFF